VSRGIRREQGRLEEALSRNWRRKMLNANELYQKETLPSYALSAERHFLAQVTEP
jgi:hypothetical protein